MASEGGVVAKQLRILVAGGLDREDKSALSRPPEEIESFARLLGARIVQDGHVLLNGCRTTIDACVAEGAHEALVASGATNDEVKSRIVCYVNQGQAPVHSFGAILQSELTDWELGGRDLSAPEIIHYCDAVVLIGGFRGTYRAANWARIEHKPLLPIALFGGAAKEICLEVAKRVDVVYAGTVSRSKYEAVLKSLSTNWEQIAADVVNLAELMASSREVFVVMSFETSPQFTDLLESIQNTCEEFGYSAYRVDETNEGERILPEIIRGIRQSAFVIADVSENKPNVYWELGLAAGMDKDIILTARKGTDLPFDINDVPVLYWDSFSEFKKALAKRVDIIATGQGRS